MIDYLNAISQNQPKGTTKNLVAAATLYDDRYHDGAYNTWAWMLFQKSSDKVELTKALEWSGKDVARVAKDSREYPNYIDTYANLLYKLDRKDEAIQWENKALAIDPDNMGFQETLKKMKAGEKTW